MKGILVDPFANTIRKVRCGGTYLQISRLIECTLFDAVLLPKGDEIYVDRERRRLPLAEHRRWTIRKFYPGEAFAGKGLLLGTDSMGTATTPRMTVDELKALVLFVWEAPMQAVPKDESNAKRGTAAARIRSGFQGICANGNPQAATRFDLENGDET
ncbi:hypothetical protein AB4Y45_16305 [Paraburkholderia sp. EG287A]|uniref:hypothetical protein n=1 Tax=unclassified Paraburkholderia TaxID=2615204 RepID=UPI0034D38EF0